MKVYFTASLSQKNQYGHIYERIVKKLIEMGHTVQADQILENSTTKIIAEEPEERDVYYQQMLKWIHTSDLIVAEASYPSTLNIGHEITLALERGKPVIILYKTGHSSLFLQGLNSDRLILMEYEEDTVEKVISDAFEYAKESADTRFNFFISPRHIAYLDWISKTRKIPRSVYLRQLIDKDKSSNLSFTDAA